MISEVMGHSDPTISKKQDKTASQLHLDISQSRQGKCQKLLLLGESRHGKYNYKQKKLRCEHHSWGVGSSSWGCGEQL